MVYYRFALRSAALALLVVAPLSARAENYALLFNGGGGVGRNKCGFNAEIRTMRSALGHGWRTTVMTGDGDGTTGDSTAPDVLECDRDGDETERYDAHGARVLQNTIFPGALPATDAQLHDWFASRLAHTRPGDQLLLYFTDHGGRASAPDHDDAHVTLWDKTLTASQLRELLKMIPADRRVVTVHDHCFSAGMLRAMFETRDGALHPLRNRCGFAAAGAQEYAYTGYTALLRRSRRASLASAHEYAMDSRKLDFLPEATSDLFLGDYAAHHRLESLDSHCRIDRNSGMIAPALLSSLEAPQRALIEARLRGLVAGLPGQFRAAHVPEGSMQGTVDDMMAQYERNRVAAAARYNAAEHQLNMAKNAYLKKVMPGDWQHSIDLEDKIAKLEEHEKYDEAAQVRRELAPIDARIEARRVGLKDSDAFKQFAHDNGGPDRRWPANIVDEEDQAEDAQDEILQDSVPLRRLARTLMNVAAIRDLLANGTPEQRSEFLDLMECESTVLR